MDSLRRLSTVLSRWEWAGIAWLVLAACCLSLGLGRPALIDPDEGRSAATALAMARSGDYAVPYLNGLPHLDKPVLFYAAGALSMRVLGPSETAARLPALLAAWATVALTAWFSAYLFGRGTAWVAGTVCATAPLTIAMSRTVIFDSLLGFFVVLALIAFYRAIESEPRSSAGLRWTLLAWGSMAGGVLTKGPVALLVPLLAAVPYAFWRRRPLAVWHPAGWMLHLLLLLPWIVTVERQIPGFLRYALVTETWGRLTTGELQRTGPVWYFLPYLLGGCFPWILAVFAAGREGWRRIREGKERSLVFLGLWLAVPFVFFSLSQSKRPQYILPLVPAVALLAAWAWQQERCWKAGTRAAALGWILLGAALLALAFGAGPRPSHMAPEILADLQPTALRLGLLLLASSALAWLAASRRRLSVVALSLPLALFPMASATLLRDVSEVRSSRNLAAGLKPYLTASTRIVGIETFSPSLTFYLNHPIEVSTADGEPLRSNFIVHSYPALVASSSSTLHPAGWWKEQLGYCPQPLIFVLKKQDHAERLVLENAGLPMLAEDGRLMAFGPCRPQARNGLREG